LIWERHYSSGALPASSKRVGSFWWKDILKLLDSYKGLAMVHVSDGKSGLFWEDLWLNKVPHIHYPQLFSSSKITDISLHMVHTAANLDEFLHLPLTPIAASQLTELAHALVSLQSTDDKGTWPYIWGAPLFSTSKAYQKLLATCRFILFSETLEILLPEHARILFFFAPPSGPAQYPGTSPMMKYGFALI